MNNSQNTKLNDYVMIRKSDIKRLIKESNEEQVKQIVAELRKKNPYFSDSYSYEGFSLACDELERLLKEIRKND